MVHWLLPPSGKLKLNVDVAVRRTHSAAGAILQNHRGELISALCFYLPLVPPIRAELVAILFALIYYSRDYDRMIIETDCRLLLQHFSTPDQFTGTYRAELQRTVKFLILNEATLQYCPREVNAAAHSLSRYGLRFNGAKLYLTLSSFPCEVRSVVALDATVPNLRL